MLYRPDINSNGIPTTRPIRHSPSHNQTSTSTTITIPLETGTGTGDDAPPKYTPPPSYTTATGARIAKMLRQSIRRSVRR